MGLDKTISERRSVRKFEKTKLTKQQIDEILETAKMTPSWANTQGWHFFILQDENRINELVDNCYPNNRASEASRSAGALFIACYETDKSGFFRGVDMNTHGSWGMFDLGAACQNIALKIHDMGLGSVIIGAYNLDKVKEFVPFDKTSKNLELGAIIAVGKKAEEPIMPKRKSIDEISTFI